MGFTTFKVEVLRLLSAYLHRAASAYLCHGALSAECKYVSEFVYLLNISSKGLVTQCPLCLNRDLCGCICFVRSREIKDEMDMNVDYKVVR